MLSAYQAQAFGIGGNANTSRGGGFEEAKAAFAQSSNGDKNGQKNAEFEDWAVLKRCRGHRGSKSICLQRSSNLHSFQESTVQFSSIDFDVIVNA